MLTNIRFPPYLTAQELDEYLARGWFRMGQVIFTTNYIVYEENLFPTHWLRYPVAAIRLSKTHQKIIKANRSFSVVVKKLVITQELKDLYQNYKSGVRFEAVESLKHFLMDGGSGDIYNSSVIEIRDQQQLIAAGIFDSGDNSIAGIINFYDPAYKKYSPGKYLILMKTLYAKEKGIAWYYPGYILEGNPQFDYKLFIGEPIASLYVPALDQWMPYRDFVRNNWFRSRANDPQSPPFLYP